MYSHLYELVLDRAACHPAADAIGGQHGLGWKTLSGRDLLDLVDRLADELTDAGVSDGDRIVFWMPNHWRTPVYLFAAWKLGAVAVPFDREMNPDAARQIIASVEPRLIVLGYGERPTWADAGPTVEWWEPGSKRASHTAAAPWGIPREELATVMFTSGTTGLPKGCMITHANLCAQADGIFDRVPLDETCRLASILPLSHLMELATLVYAIRSGAATYYVPTRRAPDVLRVLTEHRVTHMIVVPQFLVMMGRSVMARLEEAVPPRVLAAMMALADRLPMAGRRLLFRAVHRRLGGQLRLMLVGGAPMPEQTQRLWERLGVRVAPGYGTSECSPVVTLGAADGSTPIGTAGRPILGVEVKLGPDGEVHVRGASVMRGYWKDPVRTAEVLSEDGWYATGDIATIDAAGNLRLVGRARDLIVLPSGLNVWPEDVESVLRAHPAVKDAAIVAVPRARGGAAIHAYLVPAHGPGEPAGSAATLKEIVATGNARLARHQRVASASWWPDDDLPRTPLLKLKRHLLPIPRTDDVVDVPSVLAADDPVGVAVAAVARARMVRPEQTLTDLGLDSLGLVELAVALEEKTGKAVSEAGLHLEMTTEQVRAAVLAAPDADAAGEDGPSALMAGTLTPPLWAYTWGRAFRVLGRPFEWLLRWAGTPIIVLGGAYLEGLPPRVILAGTHRSFADMPLVRYALARSGGAQLVRGLISANVRTPYFHGFGGWLVVLALGAHPIDQQGEREASLRRLVQAAEAGGGSILIFPQGTHTSRARERSGDPAVRFRTGVAHLASALGAPVVPFGIAGSERVIPPSPEQFRGPVIAGVPLRITRAPLAIAFGAPVRRAPDEAPADFARRLQEICLRLSEDAEQATRAGGPVAVDMPTIEPAGSESREKVGSSR